MCNLLNIITTIGSMMFIIVVGMKLFDLKFTKYNDGTWRIYNQKIFDESNKALKELKKEIDTLTKIISMSEKRVDLLKEENASLKELGKSREEQVSSLASAIEEHNINNEPSAPDKEPDNPNYKYAIIRRNGLKEESEEAIRRSAEILNQILVKEREGDD